MLFTKLWRSWRAKTKVGDYLYEHPLATQGALLEYMRSLGLSRGEISDLLATRRHEA